jgi:hypothetical protein
MITRGFAVLAACPLLLMPVAHAGEAASLEGLDELETMVIVGGFAAPKTWKVSKGDHVMWVPGGEATTTSRRDGVPQTRAGGS